MDLNKTAYVIIIHTRSSLMRRHLTCVEKAPVHKLILGVCRCFVGKRTYAVLVRAVFIRQDFGCRDNHSCDVASRCMKLFIAAT
jgi:hypothetical protein